MIVLMIYCGNCDKLLQENRLDNVLYMQHHVNIHWNNCPVCGLTCKRIFLDTKNEPIHSQGITLPDYTEL